MSPAELDRLREELQAIAKALELDVDDLRRDRPRIAASVRTSAARLRGLCALLPDVTQPYDIS